MYILGRNPIAVLAIVLASFFPVVAGATLIVDQQQPGIDPSYPPLEVGGPMDKRLAQTFTVGIEGVFQEVHLPVQCESGVLLIEIFSLDGDVPAAPSTGLWDRGLMEASSLPPMDPPVFRSIPMEELPIPPGATVATGGVFIPPVGTRLSMVISNPTGTCTVARGVAVDPYTRGNGYFDERPLPRGWVPFTGNVEPSDDLPFKTVMEGNPPSSPCALFGGSSDFLPICRCIEDELLNEQRCTLLDPAYFMIRQLPWPIRPGETFKVQWTLIPLTELAGDVELKESLPKGFQTFLKKPLVFHADHIKPGASVTLDYTAVSLSSNGGNFAVDTAIRSPGGANVQVQTMRSIIEIAPPK